MMRDAATFGPVESRVTKPEFWSALPARWTSDVEETLVCCQVRQETHDVKSFFFRSPEGRAFVFEPGQFITLELEIDGETINRCYTISSSPTRPHTISITVKRVPGGKVSNWLHDNLQAGARVRVLGPAGEFTCARHPARKYLFLSAGSGITPLMSMSRAHHELSEDRDIVFVHSARTPDDIIFSRELDLIASNQVNFRTSFVCERVGSRTNWPGVTGFLTLPLLKLIAPDFMEREIFTCGPAPYMQAVRNLLDEAGFDRKQYHEESFSFETLIENEPEVAAEVLEAEEKANGAANGTQMFSVSFSRSNRSIECGSSQHVLDAARQAGVRLAASCTQGMCGTCKVKLVSGQVEMKHNGGIRQREIDQGMVLLCCSKPLSDLVVDK
ncbi:hybrid-cluster NAD(P)-dependent oxidoreductase [Paraburkholderia sp. PGU19]|uniref:Ferredoxin-NADP reductase n=2 Tax=Paraburkholderia TaxID=1822464 RepID=A0A7Z7BE09_9BURK|nr:MULTISPECIES: hybrid-cluster NAD(P)-dependent oxidoreductase [Paraburkholderia]AUT62208.1 hybrid-cluster NAD(P)-dependent oxidoreductase [Paraburkholderia terrae]SDI96404.1 Ferredoxin-NADP reductase [Paraburkholderia steynii]BCF99381.1 hybrid-cluster NAD(P)-dependent oxidoreductase [Paraburkholderia sp. PGU19]BCZ79620.1 hybrid-cluster NAD(P)-dependent oxidoreductase [Paraburkholderia terrae]BDC41911.1 hybrid-cluster NAD(P)-dependent oxidoreductase [Paraburkholderia terrae]